MGSQTARTLGQSTFELLIIISVLLFIFLAAIKIPDSARAKLKHQSNDNLVQLQFELDLDNQILHFKNKAQLTESGWQKFEKYFFKKNDQRLFYFQNKGLLYE